MVPGKEKQKRSFYRRTGHCMKPGGHTRQKQHLLEAKALARSMSAAKRDVYKRQPWGEEEKPVKKPADDTDEIRPVATGICSVKDM